MNTAHLPHTLSADIVLLTHIVTKILETVAKCLQYALLTNLLLASDKPFFSHMPLQLLHWLFIVDQVLIYNLHVSTFVKIVNYVYEKYKKLYMDA